MSPSRTPFIAGNWKMHKTVAEAEEYVSGLLPRVSSADGVDVAVCVPFTSLQAVVDSTRGSRVEVYAQNMHQAPEGAFTGEVSGPMLDEIGVHGVVLGHSERREHFGETDRALAEKLPAALALGLKPILCVGETDEERERGDTERKLRHQVQAGLEKLSGDQLGAVEDVDVVVAPAFLSLQAVVDSARGSAVAVYAQNMHEKDSGAFTGEVSAPMLEEIEVGGVILGHSERRQYFGETDKALQQKVPRALEAGLIPILCVGETEEERERGDTERKLRHQVQEGLEKVPKERLHEVVVAYEPIWAIGTGLTATPEQAQDAIAFVRALVADRDREQAERTRILYGGSVKADGAAELLALPDVDGALVGGASLEVDSFAAIIDAAVAAARS